MIALAPDQERAVVLACDPRGPRIMTVTGAPGTGKTTAVRTIVERWTTAGMRVALAAPTGKAARRMIQQTGHPATTIHRLLGPYRTASGRFAFTYGPGNPLPLDVLVLDETSMISIDLAARVLGALPPTARLVLVGDTHQLPAVGPGAVLGDLLASGVAPGVELTTIKRQRPGQIVLACHAIKAGRAPALDNTPGADLLHIPHEEPEDIADAILDLVLSRLPRALPRMIIGTDDDGNPLRPFSPAAAGELATPAGWREVDPLRDIQVISPTRERGPLSCAALNAAFQARMHPDDEELQARQGRLVEDGDEELGGNGAKKPARRRFLSGDKVIQIKNDYERGTVNGDVGFFRGEGKDEEGRKIYRVAFDDPAAPPGVERERIVEIPVAEAALDLAYAVTVHKYQGSEAPVIVIPLHRSFPPMLATRNLIYTAISRARTLCVLVGDEGALGAMVRRVSPTRRTTGLASMLREGRGEMVDLVSLVAAAFGVLKSEARRLIQQGAVSLDGEIKSDPNATIAIQGGEILKAGKRAVTSTRGKWILQAPLCPQAPSPDAKPSQQ